MGGKKIYKWVWRWRYGVVYCVQHLFVLVRSSDGKHAGVRAADIVFFSAKAACYDDLAILRKRFTDSVERLGFSGVKKAASVDDYRLSSLVIGRDGIALGA